MTVRAYILALATGCIFLPMAIHAEVPQSQNVSASIRDLSLNPSGATFSGTLQVGLTLTPADDHVVFTMDKLELENGESLLPPTFESDTINSGSNFEPKVPFEQRLSFARPKSGATKLKTTAGAVSVYDFEKDAESIIEIRNIFSLIGKKIVDPAFEKMGIEVNVEQPSTQQEKEKFDTNARYSAEEIAHMEQWKKDHPMKAIRFNFEGVDKTFAGVKFFNKRGEIVRSIGGGARQVGGAFEYIEEKFDLSELRKSDSIEEFSARFYFLTSKNVKEYKFEIDEFLLPISSQGSAPSDLVCNRQKFHAVTAAGIKDIRSPHSPAYLNENSSFSVSKIDLIKLTAEVSRRAGARTYTLLPTVHSLYLYGTNTDSVPEVIKIFNFHNRESSKSLPYQSSSSVNQSAMVEEIALISFGDCELLK